MAETATVTGSIAAVDQLKHSTNGNPRYRVHLDNGHDYLTQTDSAVNFDIDNLAGSGKRVTFLLTRAGRIWGYRDVEPYCNHDPAAVHNSVCECGERVE